MDLHIQNTKDGSHTLFSQKFDEIYHSRHGALLESQHVFIQAGLEMALQNTKKIELLEVGWGTGLNSLLSLQYMLKHPQVQVNYMGVEPLPVPIDIIRQLNYLAQLNQADLTDYFMKMHEIAWNEAFDILPNFQLYKNSQKIEELKTNKRFDLVYFDAFAPSKHPEMWEHKTLEHISQFLAPQGILVTYCAKGQFKRDLQSLGFDVEKLPGPPGKREMTRAVFKD